MRAVIFGDVGGHLRPFVNALEEEGIDISSRTIPKNTVVIQVGDLVHRGPDSSAIVRIVGDMIIQNEGQWIQLFGNHEAMHIRNAFEFFNCNCDQYNISNAARDNCTSDTIRSWWKNKTAHVAVALEHSPTDILPLTQTLITHAGVTSQWWNRSKLSDALNFAQFLNAYQPSLFQLLNVPGEMMGAPPNAAAGPWWAGSATEVYPSWMISRLTMPFNQVHGHTTPFSWENCSWRSSTPKILRDAIRLNPSKRFSILPTENGGSFVGIDPGYGRKETQVVMPRLIIEKISLISLKEVVSV